VGAAEEGAAVRVDVSDVDVALRLLAAVGLGGAVGFERELSDQPAGLRTHITVALGAALFGVMSVHGFDAYVQLRATSNYQIDVTRVASQVVVGVGFLGAGAILKEGLSIRGLTTAASLWATAAIGLAVGLGSFLAATITTVLLVFSFVGLRAPRRWMHAHLRRDRELLVIHMAAGADSSQVISALASIDGLDVRSLSARRRDDAVIVQADVVTSRGMHLTDLLGPIAERDDVVELDIG
jgi:putative Mg2+ transporter-C (MgtC) family protein